MEKSKLELVSTIALNRIFGFEPKYSNQIIGNLGSASAIFSLSQDGLQEIFGPYSKFKGLINDSALERAEKELDWLERSGYRFITSRDSAYPALLKECEDAPVGLYIRSASAPEEIFTGRPCISVVGTRDISLYGKEWCERIVCSMSRTLAKPVIVSGMAFGIDITAHLAALGCGLTTVGVLPTGIEEIYPKTHRIAGERIASTPGCALVTDYPPGTPPCQVNFLRRNRIIAGISKSLVLVESRKQGGGTMTARLASGYGRDVFALPGRIEDVRSEGCNRLIREMVASPIYSIPELCRDLNLGESDIKSASGLESALTEKYGTGDNSCTMKRIAFTIRKNRGIVPDCLCSMLGLGYKEVLDSINTLERDGFICCDLMQRCTINAKII